MSVRTAIVVFLALVSGLSAAVGVNFWYQQRSVERKETVSVVVADKDIPRFTLITRDMLTTHQYPKELVPPGCVLDVADADGRVATVQLRQGEVILDSRISAKGAGRGMSVAVPAGMRAFTIRTPNIASGVAGFILPGNKVDVLLTIVDTQTEITGGATTATLLQNIEILAVDQVIDAPNGNKVDPNQVRSVTLLVTPMEATQLELGQDKGSLHLALRSHADTAMAPTRPVTLREIQYPNEKPAAETPPAILAVVAKDESARRAAMPVEDKPAAGNSAHCRESGRSPTAAAADPHVARSRCFRGRRQVTPPRATHKGAEVKRGRIDAKRGN